MEVKDTYFIRIYEENDSEHFAIGECALFRGLSDEDMPNFEQELDDFCRDFNSDNGIAPSLFSSIRFGFETALADWRNGGRHIPFESKWVEGRESLLINGLVWMGTVEQMYKRACEKIEEGFGCVKLKIGGCRFNDELELLRKIRKNYSKENLVIRLDANGAFTPENVFPSLDKLSQFDIHSIEQPIKAGQWHAMAEICRESPIPIALDEELIGMNSSERKDSLLDEIKPAFVILKPSLCGGFSEAEEWIMKAKERGIGWWVTSALESAVGLNAIACWTATLETEIPQGLGTGQLYLNDLVSPLRRQGERLYYNRDGRWACPDLDWRKCQ